MAEADAADIDVHIHAIGDRTTRVALDAIEAAIAANPQRDRRHAIAHLELVDDADLPRFGRLRTVLAGGATIAFGTDWPAAGWFSTYRPLDAIEVVVTRRVVGATDGDVLEPAGERLDLAQALHAATLGAARQLRLDHLVGSIEPGKLADLVVLAQNLFDVEPSAIAATGIDITMMNGRFTHGC